MIISALNVYDKFQTLWDDNNLNGDEIENLTYYLCHLYARQVFRNGVPL